MRIALISFEYPPAVAIGGIGAYAAEAARMLSAAGEDIEVFAAGTATSSERDANGVLVHRILASERVQFSAALVSVFATRHAERPFDVLESPEVGAEGLAVAEAFPEVARVVKLHTPSYLIHELTYEPPLWSEHLRFTLGALRRGRWARLSAPIRQVNDPEARLALMADVVAAPCQAIATRVGQDWGLDPSKVQVFSLPYRPSEALLQLPVPTCIRTIGFLGRLEPRKGIIELTRAIPAVLAACPEVRFRFIGPSWPYRREDMKTWMLRQLGRHTKAVTFVGAVDREGLPEALAACDAMILPSRWENFPYACWESLAAGRLVIGSTAGGMADVIQFGVSGYLTPPRAPQEVANMLIKAIRSQADVSLISAKGRLAVLDMLSPECILPKQMKGYAEAISSARMQARL